MSRASLLIVVSCALTPAQGVDELAAARHVGTWLASVAIETEHGVCWPSVPARPKPRPASMYSGSSGVILFLLELHAATDDPRWLTLARRGADDLVANLDPSPPGGHGLYTGTAGIGFTLGQVAKVTRATTSSDEDLDVAKYAAGAKRCLEIVKAANRPKKKGGDWNGVTDIISGTAGIGLWLLQTPEGVPVATRAGEWLLFCADETEHGLSWKMTPRYARLMPNFSHGTAGVAYFLAELHAKTKRKEFLDAAIAGARHVVAIADRAGDGFRVHHHSPGGTDLYYLGWCHGPCGTARLFRRLDQLGAKGEWKALQRACGEAILLSGIPVRRTPGFWNNVGWCCGTAGVGDFLLALHRWTGDDRWLKATDPFTRDLVARATKDEKGWRWKQAEHRVRPKLLQTQTGLMQGAAGAGMWFLRRHAARKGAAVRVRLPDEPR